MDPMALAASTVALLAPFLARMGGQVADQLGNELGEAVVGRLGRLYEFVKAKVAGDRFLPNRRLSDCSSSPAARCDKPRSLGYSGNWSKLIHRLAQS